MSSAAMMPSSEALWASAGPGDEVADRVHARARWCACAPSTLHEPALVELDAGLGQAEALDVGAAAGGDHQVVDLGRARRRRRSDTVLSPVCTSATSVPVWTAMPWRLRPRSTSREMSASSRRQHAVERLEQQHLAAQAREARGDLRARGARADDRQARGQLRQRPGLLGADHAPAELDAGDRRAAPSRWRGSRRAAADDSSPTRTSPSAVSARVALDQVDPVLLEQARRRPR